MTETPASPNNRRLYTAVWRWHFYAGLLSTPICILLGVTGAIYLFKPFAEPWLYADMQQVANVSDVEPLSPDLQLQAAADSMPDARTAAMRFGSTPAEATEVTLRDSDGQQHLVYVNPYSGVVTGRLQRDGMFMNVIRELHGDLMGGWFGSAFVELTAGWTLILILTGLWLWWPRNGSRIKGVLVPRIRLGGRIFWRDLHSVAGFYLTAFIGILLITGLPWTGVWGSALKQMQGLTGQNRPAAAGFRTPYKSDPADGKTRLTVSEAVRLADEQGMPSGYQLLLPRGPQGTYGFSHRALKLEESRYIYVDQYSGKVLADASWSDFPPVAKAISFGIRLHQGELFGLTGFLAMLLGAIGVVWLSITGIVMWWRRRPAGELGVPPMPDDWRIPRGITWITVAAGVLLPLVGASLILLLACERWVFPRFPAFSRFIGLQIEPSPSV